MASFYTSQKERSAGAAARSLTRQRARKLKVSIEERFSGGWHELVLTAPTSFRFTDGLHEYVVANAGPTTDGLWQQAQQRLAEADVERCTTR